MMTTSPIAPIARLFPPQYPGVSAGSTPEFPALIADLNGVGVPAASLNVLTLSIVDTASKSVINMCSQVNILNTGRGTVDSSGNMVIVLTAADTALFNSASVTEERSLIIDYAYNSSSRTGRYEIRFMVFALSGL